MASAANPTRRDSSPTRTRARSRWLPFVGGPGSLPGLPRFLSSLSLAFLLLPAPAPAQNVRAIALSAENDGFVFWTPIRRRTDWYYTNGLRAEALLAWAPPLARVLAPGEPTVCPSEGSTDPCLLTRITVGQAIYTPAFLFDEEPHPRDRPYAGWLYLRATSARVSRGSFASLGLELGVTGRPSLAGPLHRWFHRSLGKHEPQGWDHQIPFELAFALQYEARRAVPLLEGPRGTSIHVQPKGSLTVGTVRTGATGGGSLLLGWNAPPMPTWLGPQEDAAFLQIALGAEAEWVLRDLFLDGSTWSPSGKVERVPVLGRMTGSIQLGWHALALEVTATRTSAQFKGQDGSHTVAAVSLIIRR